MSSTSASARMLHILALAVVVAGAAAALGLMLRVAHPPPTLLALFTVWVLSPFVALGFASAGTAGFASVPAATRHAALFAIVAGSLVVYGGMVPMPAGTRPAFPYLIVPLASWIVIVVTLVRAGRRR